MPRYVMWMHRGAEPSWVIQEVGKNRGAVNARGVVLHVPSCLYLNRLDGIYGKLPGPPGVLTCEGKLMKTDDRGWYAIEEE